MDNDLRDEYEPAEITNELINILKKFKNINVQEREYTIAVTIDKACVASNWLIFKSSKCNCCNNILYFLNKFNIAITDFYNKYGINTATKLTDLHGDGIINRAIGFDIKRNFFDSCYDNKCSSINQYIDNDDVQNFINFIDKSLYNDFNLATLTHVDENVREGGRKSKSYNKRSYKNKNRSDNSWYETQKNLIKTFRSEKFLVSNRKGFNQFYLIAGGEDLKTTNDEIEIEGKFTANKLKNAFIKMNKKKQVNRILVSKFIQGIAA